MGNLISTNDDKKNMYEPLSNRHINYINLSEQIQQILERNQLLEEEIKFLKRDLEVKMSNIELKYNECNNSLSYYNEQHNEKINIMTKDMENLLNNDKILLDKLIEKNIVSTIEDDYPL